MAKQKQQVGWPNNMTNHERLVAAKTCAEAVLDHARQVLRVHESNRLLVFSDQIARQIPVSYGAHTFNDLQESQYKYEILRLCALWDNASSDRQSIPTIIKLIDDHEIVEAVAEETKSGWMSIGTSHVDLEKHDAETQKWIQQAVEASECERAIQQSRLAKRHLRAARCVANKIRNSTRFKAIEHIRHTYTAHALDPSKVAAPPQAMKYGDEKWLMDWSITVISWLNLALRGASFDWDESRKIAQRTASAFWGGVTVSVKE